MRVRCRDWNLVSEFRAEPLNCADGCKVAGIASNRNCLVNRTDERRNGTASLKRITMPTKLLTNLETNVPGANSNMHGVTNSKIDVSDI